MSLEENLYHWSQYQSQTMKQTYVCRNRFLLLEKLGKGGFGLIYSGVDLQTGRSVAIKLEDSKLTKKRYLRLEYHIYRRYHSSWFYLPYNEERNLPDIHFYGVDKNYRILVMDLLGPSLADLFLYCENKFSVKTTAMLAIKMISAIEFLHSKGIVHRDTKPGNFVMGHAERCNDLFLIDYGLASLYIDKAGKHVPFQVGVRFHGTDKYASITNHKKTSAVDLSHAALDTLAPGRRDDMESIGYLIVMFLKGDLPWSEKFKDIRRKYRRIAYGKMKAAMDIKDLTAGCPSAVTKYFEYVESLYYSDRPDYDYLRGLFYMCISEIGELFDNVFDWTMNKKEFEDIEGREKSSEKKEQE